jgi:hypothetical protein
MIRDGQFPAHVEVLTVGDRRGRRTVRIGGAARIEPGMEVLQI